MLEKPHYSDTNYAHNANFHLSFHGKYCRRKCSNFSTKLLKFSTSFFDGAYSAGPAESAPIARAQHIISCAFLSCFGCSTSMMSSLQLRHLLLPQAGNIRAGCGVGEGPLPGVFVVRSNVSHLQRTRSKLSRSLYCNAATLMLQKGNTVGTVLSHCCV